MNILAYAIVTIPDTDAGRREFDLKKLDDKEAAKAMLHMVNQRTGQAELPLHLRKIAALATVRREGSYVLEVNSGDSSTASEEQLLKDFLAAGRVKWPTLIGWDHDSFIRPLMNFRILKYALPAERYFPSQAGDEGMLDLQSLTGAATLEGKATLHEIASLLDVPYGDPMSAKQVWQAWLNDDHQAVIDYAELRVMMTYRIYLRYLVTKGELTAAEYGREVKRISS